MLHAGETFYLPPRPPGDVLPDPDSHPHALARDCEQGQGAHLFFGSTSDRESREGAAFRTVRPVPDRSSPHCNGLLRNTFVYPGVVVAMPSRRLPRRAGRIGPEWMPILRACRVALGIGTHSCASGGTAVGSLRGRIVRLGGKYEQKLYTSSYVVLTEHAYSARARYQVVLPIDPVAESETESQEGVVVVQQPWIAALGPDARAARLMAPLLFSVWQQNTELVPTRYVVDEESLVRIETMLCAHLCLPGG